MTVRYIGGLILAFLAYGAASIIFVVTAATIAGRPGQIPNGIAVFWFVFGAPSMLALAGGIGPAILAIRWFAGGPIPRLTAAAIGCVASPLLLLSTWLVFAESEETFVGLLRFWARLPLEFVFGLLPHLAASTFFCVCLPHVLAGERNSEQGGVNCRTLSSRRSNA